MIGPLRGGPLARPGSEAATPATGVAPVEDMRDRFLRDLWRKYREDHVSILVSSLAYYTFFSFFPILLLLASIIGFVYGTREESVQLPRQILDLFPFRTEVMSEALDRIVLARHSLGFFGSVLLICS